MSKKQRNASLAEQTEAISDNDVTMEGEDKGRKTKKKLKPVHESEKQVQYKYMVDPLDPVVMSGNSLYCLKGHRKLFI